ncbi:hypothetical protein AMECASPLE_016158 [Ameca splendens]|uniref:HMA domain-containing protein n=1 Tax=Ameca splendens TaxID=208324 RepID=A0ABV0XRD0_9TELE
MTQSRSQAVNAVACSKALFTTQGEAVMTQKVNLSSVSLRVEGMTCGSCVQSIEQRIGSLHGVIHIKARDSRPIHPPHPPRK